MPFQVRIHFDNSAGFQTPHLRVWYTASSLHQEVPPSGGDAFGPYFDLSVVHNFFRFKFKEGASNRWEPSELEREHWPISPSGKPADEIWCKGDRAFVYHVQPRAPAADTAAQAVQRLQFVNNLYIPGTGGLSGLGAQPLAGGGVLFGLYHPNAARVCVFGDFNNWQHPNSPTPNPAEFIELNLHVGWFGVPNIWLAVVRNAKPGDEYKFFVEGGVPRWDDGRPRRDNVDPYARRLGPDFSLNNGVVENPSTFGWTDGGWTTPDMADLILYELSVYGFTEGDPDIASANHGRFAGITERIRAGYFRQLGVTALSLMPLAEIPSMQSPNTLGYNPSLYFSVERDFGSPDDLRALVDAAHGEGLAVLLDQVFNHTANDFNPLWRLILEHPGEEASSDGGLYFNGGTPWGNRVATEKEDVQNMLIDACKMLIREYHVDGFRYDATHRFYMDHGFLERMARELKGFKPDVLLIAENLPNEADLNRYGYDGFAQWCDPFHDKIKALLREGPFEGQSNSPDGLGDIFFFSRSIFASHTNNVVNYCESHDEHSVSREVGYTPELNNPAAKERKGRLGLFASMVALGQPMIYMGQEFNVDRERNVVTVDWLSDLGRHGFFQWAWRLINLRRRYPGLRLRGYNPAEDGRFAWVLGPWLDGAHGGGRRIIGWRSRPNDFAYDTLLVMMNFEGTAQVVDVEFGIPGVWVKLADIDRVNDMPPAGGNSAGDATAVRTNDGRFAGFELPSSSGFIYKWEASL